MLMSSLGDSVHQLVHDVQNNTLKIPAPRRRGEVAGRRPEGPYALVEGACGPAGAGAEHAAADRRPGENSPGLGRQHRWWLVAVPGRLHHCRHHHGLRRRRAVAASRAIFERIVGKARGANWQAVHGDHSCRRPRGDRCGLHPGHHRRLCPAGRRGPVGRSAGGDRAGPRHRPGAGADRDLARDRLHLVERRLRQLRRRSPTPCCCSCRAWRTTC